MQVQTEDQETIYTHRTIDGYKARVLSYFVNNIDLPYAIAVLNDNNNKEYVNQYSVAEFKTKFFEYNLWEHVEVDTPILVRDNPCDPWIKMHFSRYEDGKVFTWYAGCTSWSCIVQECNAWNYAKLPDKE